MSQSRTDAQREADDVLTAAVQQVITAYGLLPEGAIFSDFIAVVEGIKYPNGDDRFDDYHAIVFRDGQMRRSVARGLLGEGLDLLRYSGMVVWESGDDDEQDGPDG